MSAVQLRTVAALPRTLSASERTRGEVDLIVHRQSGVSRPRRFFQSGAGKIRLSRNAPAEPLSAVVINTAGGVTGGDRLKVGVAVETEARAVVTTQAAERIYRRLAGVASIETRLSVDAGARLDWIPQETILFDRSALDRRLTADVHPEARLLAVESIILGRTAMGENIHDVAVLDSWRVRRGGRLVFADALRLDGDATGIMRGMATGNGARAFATLVLVAPDAEASLATAREALTDCHGEAGASAWNGILVARLSAGTGQGLCADVVRLLTALRGTPLPRVWNL